MAQTDKSLRNADEAAEGNTDIEMTQTNILLKRYEREIDLYKFYLDISVKASLFAFGVTGALLSYYFTNREDNEFLVWSLSLPMILNAGFFVLFFASIRASTKMTCDHENTCKQLNDIEAFDTNPLPALCKILSFMYGLVTIGLFFLLFIHII